MIVYAVIVYVNALYAVIMYEVRVSTLIYL